MPPAHPGIRPPPMPPPASPPRVEKDSAGLISDNTPISAITGMRVNIWREVMSRGGARSYRALFPEQTKAILHAIEFGAPIEFEGNRMMVRSSENHGSLAEHSAAVRAIIQADVAAGKKAGPFDSPLLADGRTISVSPLGAVTKTGSTKVRVIHDLSFPRVGGTSINAGIDNPYLPISSFGHAARAVVALGRGCLLIKLDVEAAYKQVPVDPKDWHLLGFMFEGKFYYERVLPFGLRSSCRLWDMFAAALHFFCENLLGMSSPKFVVHYVDDFLFVVQSVDGGAAARSMLEGALALCKLLGVPMSEKKTEGPTTCLTFLGIELDTVAMEARLSEERLAELRRLCVGWQSTTHASAQELQSLAGKLNFACSVIGPGRIFMHHIFTHISHILDLSTARRFKVLLPRTVLEDIAWWVEFLPQWNGKSLLYDLAWENAPDIHLSTDACEYGYGGYFQGQWFAGRWPPHILALAARNTKLSMPFLELLALVVAAGTFGHLWARKKITFHCDCQPAVDAVRGQGSRRPQQMHLIRTLARIAIANNFDYNAIHIPGLTNVIADELSRAGDSVKFRAMCPNAQVHPTPTVWPDMTPLAASAKVSSPRSGPAMRSD